MGDTPGGRRSVPVASRAAGSSMPGPLGSGKLRRLGRRLPSFAPSLGILWESVCDHVPGCTRVYVGVKLRPDPRVVIKCAHPDRDLCSFWPVSTEQARSAGEAERLHRSLSASIASNQLLALQQPKLLAPDPHLGTDRSP